MILMFVDEDDDDNDNDEDDDENGDDDDLVGQREMVRGCQDDDGLVML